MISFPNAKINMGLNITSKRSDGFHNIESVFFPVGWCDILEIICVDGQEEDVAFSSSGIEIPGNKVDNLCVKAYHLLKNDFDLPAVAMHLHKKIPIGAGLGGGSSDAAFALKMMNSIFALKLTDERIIEYARKLGSDCAFFVKNEPCFAFEKGDRFDKVELNLDGYFLMLIWPGIHVATAEAYAGVIPAKAEKSLAEMVQKPISEWKGMIVNDFEKSVFKKYPTIKDLKDKLYAMNAVYASMSGSGSAVYALFENEPVVSDELKVHLHYVEKIKRV